MSERLLPSDIENLKMAGDSLQQSSQGGLKYSGSKIEKLCDEIEASWAEIESLRVVVYDQGVNAISNNMKYKELEAFSDKLCAEIEQLRAIALAAAEEMANSPATDSPLFDAVRQWQKSHREKA